LQKKEFPKWLQDRIAAGTATVHPHGTFKVRRGLTLQDKLQSVTTLEELEGFANRRKYGAQVEPWTEEERCASGQANAGSISERYPPAN
jgi:hypothetical protein